MARRHGPTRAAAALLMLCAAGGAWAGIFSDDEARKQVAEQRARADALEARLSHVEEQLNSKSLLDLYSAIEELKQEVTKLQGDIDLINNTLDGNAKRQRDMYLDLDTRLRRFEQPGGAVPAAGMPATPDPASAVPAVTGATPQPAVPVGAPAVVATVAPPLAGGEDAAYEAAQTQRRAGSYAAAIAGFQSFLKQYPRSGLAPRAQYWVGDSYFNLRDFKSAIAAQETLVKSYPESPSVPDALLNIASAQSELGDAAASKKTLKDIVTRYPVSDAADKARKRLEGGGAKPQ